MRGFYLSSVLGLLCQAGVLGGLLSLGSLAACGPAKPPADASDVQEATTKLAPPSDDTPRMGTSSTPPAGGGGGESAPPPASAADGQPHLPPDFGGRSYERESAEVVLRRAARQVKNNCATASDDTGKASGPWGKTSVSVVMGHNGHSKSATIPAPFDGKPTGRCATQAFIDMQYPPFSGPDTTVEWDIEIVKPGS